MAGKRKRARTRTSAFGTSGRISHDSSEFYKGRLYDELPREQEPRAGPGQGGGPIENAVPAKALDRVLLHTAERMVHLPDDCVHLMVTSPPYNVGKQYDEDLTLAEYRAFLKRVWAETARVLVPGGRMCINVANLGRKPYIPLHGGIAQDCNDLGLLMRGEIIWNKAASGTSSTAWGSWLSAKNPTLRDLHEYILVFSKGTYSRDGAGRRSTLERDEFLALTQSIWTFPAQSARAVGHPAPFPVELPYRLIQLYTFEGDVVLDPFMGSGQTALAALKAGRHFVGYEVNPEYVALAEKRIRDYRASP